MKNGDQNIRRSCQNGLSFRSEFVRKKCRKLENLLDRNDKGSDNEKFNACMNFARTVLNCSIISLFANLPNIEETIVV